MAALAIINVLSTLLGISVDTTDLAETAREAKERMKQASAFAMGEYIEHFTQPIWEQGEEGEDEDDDDGDV